MICELVYRSNSTIALDDAVFNNEMARILAQSVHNNAQINVTGFLLYFDQKFAQILEGDFDAVTKIYGKIRRDHSHSDCRIISFSEKRERVFDEFSMMNSMNFIIRNQRELEVKLRFLNRFITEGNYEPVMIRDLLVSIAQEIKRKRTFPRERHLKAS